MEDVEVFEEVVVEDFNESVDDVELVDSIEEVESSDSYSTDELVSALLHLLNEQASQEDEENEIIEPEVETSSDQEEFIPEQVPDYTDLLTSLDSRLYTLEAQALEPEEDYSIYTPLNEYKLDSILLVFIFIVTLINLGYQFLKDNFLHF